MKSKVLPLAFLVVAFGCGGRAAEESGGGSSGAPASGGNAAASNSGASGGSGVINGLCDPAECSYGVGGSGAMDAGAMDAGAVNVLLACEPDNLSLLPLCTTPMLIGTACDSTTFRYCRQGAENVLCGPPGSCIPVSDGGGYYD